MPATYLDFEKPLADLEKKIAELETAGGEAVGDEVVKLREKAAKQLEHIYGHLNAWQKTQVARHPDRPHFLDYVNELFEEFVELAGDRKFMNDDAIRLLWSRHLSGEALSESERRQLLEAIGTAEWTGTPLAGVLAEAGVDRDAVEIVFTGADRGVQGGQEHDYARSLSGDGHEITAVYVEINPENTEEVRKQWEVWAGGVPLKVLHSPFRSITKPLINFINEESDQHKDSITTIVLPEFVPRAWWQQLLHNQTALLLKGKLLFARNIVVTSVPHHLRR